MNLKNLNIFLPPIRIPNSSSLILYDGTMFKGSTYVCIILTFDLQKYDNIKLLR